MTRDSSTYEELISQVRRAALLILDVESPLDRIVDDGQYLDLWVVACRDNVPLFLRVVDLTRGAEYVTHELESIVREAREYPRTPVRSVDEIELPLISVVIPTSGERLLELDACLKSLADQEYAQFEVIVADNRRHIPSPDPLVELVKKWPLTRLVYEQIPGAAAARNRGVANAKGDVVAFTDDDAVVGPRWLRSFGIEFALDPNLDVATGLILPAELDTPAQLWFEYYYGGFAGQRSFKCVTLSSRHRRSSRFDVRDVNNQLEKTAAIYGVGAFGASVNMAVRTSSFRALGGFNVALGTGTLSRGGEDLGLLMRTLWSGGRIRYQPNAYVLHRHRPEFEALLHQMDGYGLGYTAALTSLVVEDPRHLFAFTIELIIAMKSIVSKFWKNLRGRNHYPDTPGINRQFPKELASREYRGLLKGPLAYFRSRRLMLRMVNQSRFVV